MTFLRPLSVFAAVLCLSATPVLAADSGSGDAGSGDTTGDTSADQTADTGSGDAGTEPTGDPTATDEATADTGATDTSGQTDEVTYTDPYTDPATDYGSYSDPSSAFDYSDSGLTQSPDLSDATDEAGFVEFRSGDPEQIAGVVAWSRDFNQLAGGNELVATVVPLVTTVVPAFGIDADTLSALAFGTEGLDGLTSVPDQQLPEAFALTGLGGESSTQVSGLDSWESLDSGQSSDLLPANTRVLRDFTPVSS